MAVSEDESTSLSVNIFEDLDIIFTKEASVTQILLMTFQLIRNRNAPTMIQR